MKGGTPDRHQEARNPDRSWRRSHAPPPAARRVVFHEGAGRLAGPIGIVCRRSPAPVKGGPLRADAHPHHSRAGRTPQTLRQHARRDSTSPGHGQRPADQPGQCATGLPTLAVTQSNHQNEEDAPEQWGHDAGDPGADKEMTEASGPQESGGPPPPTASNPMSPHRKRT